MAQNIAPSLAARDNEVQGLLAWSVVPVRLALFFSLSLGIHDLFFLSISAAVSRPTVLTVFHAAQALGFLFIAAKLATFVHFTTRYVHSEENSSLVRAMAALTGFWAFLALVIFCEAFPIGLRIAKNAGLFSFGTSFLFWVLLPILGGGVVILLIRSRVFSLSKSFNQQIDLFARVNLSRTRTIAISSILAGGLYLGLYATNRLTMGVDYPFVMGVVSIVSGVSLVFVWKGVREINRNATLIYFERTLEKLNFFWLISCIGFATRLVTRLIVLF